MKRLFVLVTALVTFASAAFCQQKLYFATDRSIYLAGEPVFCSVFCTENGLLSSAHNIAYLELSSTAENSVTAKAALSEGRGCARVDIPEDLPTGNYALTAYLPGGGARFSKVVSIFNTSSVSRVRDGVEVISEEEYRSLAWPRYPVTDNLKFRVAEGPDGTSKAYVSNAGESRLSLSIGVVRADGIVPPSVSGAYAGEEQSAPCEGEIVRAKLVGSGKAASAVLSTLGNVSNIYFASVGENGIAQFHTGNIFGEGKVVLEPLDVTDGECHFELESPFTTPAPACEVPKLAVSKCIGADLTERDRLLNLQRADRDSVRMVLPFQETPAFGAADRVYRLDDYTRFLNLPEVIVEILPELKVVKSQGVNRIGVLVGGRFSEEALVMMDGVPVTDHQTLLSYDPLLIESVSVYCGTYSFDGKIIRGAANFETYKHTAPGFKFPSNAVKLRFRGAAIPEIISTPDRQTIYWNPLVVLEPGQEISVPYAGSALLTVDGIDESGCRACLAAQVR